jgi:hypothetical protein
VVARVLRALVIADSALPLQPVVIERLARAGKPRRRSVERAS